MKYAICLLCTFMTFASCTGQTSNNTTAFTKTSSLVITRFDRDLHQYLKTPDNTNLKNIQNKYKDFLPAFGRITINNSDSYKPEFYTRIRQYFGNQMLSRIYDDALSTFSDLSAYEKELSIANQNISENFTDKQLPALYVHVSGFKENAMVINEGISISIDKYLGTDYPAYKQFFEDYQRIQMQPKMIVRDYLRAWLLSDAITAPQKAILLDEIVREGKVLYSLSKLLPDWSNEDLIGFTSEQITWCTENEKQIWTTVVQKNHLYEQDYQIINKYLNEAPYTATLTSDSPGRTGAWLGWQIVKSYISKKNTSLSQLMNIEAQQLLKDAGYTP